MIITLRNKIFCDCTGKSSDDSVFVSTPKTWTGKSQFGKFSTETFMVKSANSPRSQKFAYLGHLSFYWSSFLHETPANIFIPVVN